jgi:Uncharacterised protein family (UPF0236)
MNVEVTLRVDGREVAHVRQEVSTDDSLELEQQCERLQRRVGQVVLEVGWERLAADVRRPRCCGHPMKGCGRRTVTLATMSGDVSFHRTRYHCEHCGAWLVPADALVCCGNHRITRLLAQRICQLATVEHFTRLEQVVADQHGVHVGHEPMLQLVHDVGGAAEAERLAQAERQQSHAASWPEAEQTPQRVYVSCDGIMYCTNQSEPDLQRPGERRLLWKQMRVGCVYWQDAREKWHKRVIWGQEEDQLSFGASLYRLACRCGYRQAEEKIFAADGGEWCWTIRQQYFPEAAGVLDWYHASEHVWTCGRLLSEDPDSWVQPALTLLREEGGEGLLRSLRTQRPRLRGRKRQALDALIGYLQPRLDRTDYPAYRSRGWQIGTGMIESTARQLVGLRLKGPGMHWTPHGATAVTALRAQDINGNWHAFWKNLALPSKHATTI